VQVRERLHDEEHECHFQEVHGTQEGECPQVHKYVQRVVPDVSYLTVTTHVQLGVFFGVREDLLQEFELLKQIKHHDRDKEAEEHDHVGRNDNTEDRQMYNKLQSSDHNDKLVHGCLNEDVHEERENERALKREFGVFWSFHNGVGELVVRHLLLDGGGKSRVILVQVLLERIWNEKVPPLGDMDDEGVLFSQWGNC